MTSYASFARFYDAVNGEPVDRVQQILATISAYFPSATSVLELGCGTGAILAGLGSAYELTGIDLSVEMLSIAQRQCPQATLVHGDITDFDLLRTFDVVICVFDTLNHVTTVDGWLSVIDHVRHHLNKGGVFIVDINTVERLRHLADSPPRVHDFDGNTLIIDVEWGDASLTTWDIRIFEHTGENTFVLHHEQIEELGIELADVRRMFREGFELLEETDTYESPPTDDSPRAYLVFRRRENDPGENR